MPNNCLSVLYKHINQVENKNVGGGGGGAHKHIIAPLPHQKSRGSTCPLPPFPTPVQCHVCLYYFMTSRFHFHRVQKLDNDYILLF